MHTVPLPRAPIGGRGCSLCELSVACRDLIILCFALMVGFCAILEMTIGIRDPCRASVSVFGGVLAARFRAVPQFGRGARFQLLLLLKNDNQFSVCTQVSDG